MGDTVDAWKNDGSYMLNGRIAMQLFKTIGVGILAFIAISNIAWFGQEGLNIPENQHFLYMGMMVGSVAFLHWALLSYLIPMKSYPTYVRKRISEGLKKQYHRSFITGIEAGYLLIAMGVFQFLHPLDSSFLDYNFFMAALFFIALSVFAKARRVTDLLIQDMQKNQPIL